MFVCFLFPRILSTSCESQLASFWGSLWLPYIENRKYKVCRLSSPKVRGRTWCKGSCDCLVPVWESLIIRCRVIRKILSSKLFQWGHDFSMNWNCHSDMKKLASLFKARETGNIVRLLISQMSHPLEIIFWMALEESLEGHSCPKTASGPDRTDWY